MTAEVPVVIATAHGRQKWLEDCVESILWWQKPVTVIETPYWELGAIARASTIFDKFLLLQDSVVIRNPKFFEVINSYSLSGPLMWPSCCYMGIYERRYLDQMEIPEITPGEKGKMEAVANESAFCEPYFRLAGSLEPIFPGFGDWSAKKVVQRHGRDNLLLEHQYFTKYKGYWTGSFGR